MIEEELNSSETSCDKGERGKSYFEITGSQNMSGLARCETWNFHSALMECNGMVEVGEIAQPTAFK
jgi:hypothetical protein